MLNCGSVVCDTTESTSILSTRAPVTRPPPRSPAQCPSTTHVLRLPHSSGVPPGNTRRSLSLPTHSWFFFTCTSRWCDPFCCPWILNTIERPDSANLLGASQDLVSRNSTAHVEFSPGLCAVFVDVSNAVDDVFCLFSCCRRVRRAPC